MKESQDIEKSQKETNRPKERKGKGLPRSFRLCAPPDSQLLAGKTQHQREGDDEDREREEEEAGNMF